MEFVIHDVGHGFCAHLRHGNGNVMLWDCGHKNEPEHRPSVFLPEQGIHAINHLFITNYDEDHISDLPDIRSNLGVDLLTRNKSITTDQLRQLKLENGSLTAAMESFLEMNNSYTAGVSSFPDFDGVTYNTYHCNFSDFQDTNNLSLVTFLEVSNTKFVIPGDLELAGWLKLLEDQSFRDHLADVNYFIASHHGRTSGYCADVFKICHPNCIIFSDGAVQYATQEEANCYRQHASGIQFNGEERYVLSTRNDGSLTWTL
jgi:beta-lactamase superfamily II metal-dependent hydrolase